MVLDTQPVSLQNTPKPAIDSDEETQEAAVFAPVPLRVNGSLLTDHDPLVKFCGVCGERWHE